MSEEQAKYEINKEQESAIQSKLAAMFAANKDEITVPKIYVDMTDDLRAAMVLDELMFWTLPKRGGRTSLRVFKSGHLWLAVRRSDWWDRKRLSERQADGAIAKLVELELIEKDVFLFDGKPTVHIRIKMSNFVKLYSEKILFYAGEEDQDFTRDIADLYEMMGFPNETVNSILPNGEMLNSPNGEIINSLQQPPKTSSLESENFQNKREELKNFLAENSIESAILQGKPLGSAVNKQKDIYEFETMIDAQLARLKLNWNGFRDPEKDAFRRFLKTERKRGRELETWVNWWMSDEWRVAHPLWKLDAIKAQWLKAFAEEKKLREVRTDENGTPMSY